MRARGLVAAGWVVLCLTTVGAVGALASEEADVAAFPSPTSAPLGRLAAAVAGVGIAGWGLTMWMRRRSRSTPDDERIEVVALLPLGYPAEDPPPRSRHPLKKVAFEETWGRPLEV